MIRDDYLVSDNKTCIDNSKTCIDMSFLNRSERFCLGGLCCYY